MLTHLKTLPQIFQNFSCLFTTFEELFPQPQKLAIAVSGGSDSMLLSLAMYTFRKEKNRDTHKLFFLHCNHGMRAESKQEAVFLSSFFSEFQFKIFERRDQNPANEEALRNRRYAEFASYMQQHQIPILLTGHNLTDRIESTLLNLLRGAGLKGFLAMQSQTPHHLLEGKLLMRPLLALPKTEVQKCCDELAIPYCMDQSNQDDSISKRNLIRNRFLLPLADHALQTEGKNSFFTSRNTVYQELETRLASSVLHFLEPMKISPYRELQHAYQWKVLPEWIDFSGISQLLDRLQICASGEERKTLLNWLQKGEEGFRTLGGWQLLIAHQSYYFFHTKKQFWTKEIRLEKEIKAWWRQNFWLFYLEIPEHLIWATLRFPRPGDKYHGKALTKRALNQKIPIFWRNALPLAEKEGKIIFVWKPEMLMF